MERIRLSSVPRTCTETNIVCYSDATGLGLQRALSDNGSRYNSRAFRDARRELGVKHVRARPYLPRTYGKAERFIQTALREWAYARAYDTSDQRAEALRAGRTAAASIVPMAG